MNWKQQAIDRLKQMPYMERSLECIPTELHRLEQEASTLGSASLSLSRTANHRSRENRFLNNCMQRQHLRQQLEDARLWLKSTRKALDGLTQEQRQLLQYFYVRPVNDPVDRLCRELGLERSSVYRHRDKALQTFATCLYGPTNIKPSP